MSVTSSMATWSSRSRASTSRPPVFSRLRVVAVWLFGGGRCSLSGCDRLSSYWVSFRLRRDGWAGGCINRVLILVLLPKAVGRGWVTCPLVD